MVIGLLLVLLVLIIIVGRLVLLRELRSYRAESSSAFLLLIAVLLIGLVATSIIVDAVLVALRAGGGGSSIGLAPTTPPKPSIAQAMQAELARMTKGSILYNPPTEMAQGEEERIEVRVTQSISEDLALGLQGSGHPIQEAISVGTFMKAKLTGDSFTIAALSSEEQVVGEAGFTEWVWTVVPEEAGDQELHLTVTARVRVDDITEAKDVLVKDARILVKVNAVYSAQKFAQENWQWIATAIVIPLVGYLWINSSKHQGRAGDAKPMRRRRRKKVR